MKKLNVVFAALVAVFAFGALTVASASAVTFLLAEWLVKGVAVAAALPSESTGELILEDIKGGLFLEDAAVLCSGILVGTVEPASKDTITELLTLTLGGISTTPLSGEGLVCSDDLNCPEPDRVWAEHLPWNTEVELAEEGGEIFWVDLLKTGGAGNPAWEVTCFGIEDLCEATEAAVQLLLSADAKTLLGEFSEGFRELMGAPTGTCERGGAGSGLVFSDIEGPITLQGIAEELSVSSESIEA